jgi:hypothetical protein
MGGQERCYEPCSESMMGSQPFWFGKPLPVIQREPCTITHSGGFLARLASLCATGASKNPLADSRSSAAVSVFRLGPPRYLIGPPSDVTGPWDRVIVVGEVRYCQKTGPRKYSVGLRIVEIVGGGKVLQIKPNAA